jgi:hypothetical protein
MLGFMCLAALIDLIMIQINRDPPVPLTFACERSIGALIDDCPAVQRPRCTTSLVRGSMAARTALANFTDSLRCATRCRHMANMSTITAASTAQRNTIALPSSITSALSFSKSLARARAPLPSHGPSPPSLAASPFARSKQSLVARCSYTVPLYKPLLRRPP